jgi:hypothetical protein
MTDGNGDVRFDCESLKQRVHVLREKQERAEKLKFTREYIERCAQRFRKTHPEAPKRSLGAMLDSAAGFARSEGARAAAAGLVLACFAGWIGHALYARYADVSDRASAQRCLNANFSHSINGVCYDDRRRVHTIEQDGTARKGVADRKVWVDTGFRVANPGE